MSGPPMKGPYDPDRIRERVARAGDGTMRDALVALRITDEYNDPRFVAGWNEALERVADALATRSEAAEGLFWEGWVCNMDCDACRDAIERGKDAALAEAEPKP